MVKVPKAIPDVVSNADGPIPPELWDNDPTDTPLPENDPAHDLIEKLIKAGLDKVKAKD